MPKIFISAGQITISGGILTAKQAIQFNKRLKQAIRELKASYCANGHFISEETSTLEIVRGYKVRRCKVCKAGYDALKYAVEKLDARTNAQ
jgi:hypothetical protein